MHECVLPHFNGLMVCSSPLYLSLPDDAAPHPDPQFPPLAEEYSHSLSPNPPSRLCSRAKFTSKRGEASRIIKNWQVWSDLECL